MPWHALLLQLLEVSDHRQGLSRRADLRFPLAALRRAGLQQHLQGLQRFTRQLIPAGRLLLGLFQNPDNALPVSILQHLLVRRLIYLYIVCGGDEDEAVQIIVHFPPAPTVLIP